MGYLYGSYTETNEVKVEVIYEPPQECTHEGFELLEDERAEKVQVSATHPPTHPLIPTVSIHPPTHPPTYLPQALAEALNLKKVGWIFAHPPREEGFVFSGQEVMQAAMEQLEAAEGVKETPFVTVRVTLAEENGEVKKDSPTHPPTHPPTHLTIDSSNSFKPLSSQPPAHPPSSPYRQTPISTPSKSPNSS